MLKIRCKNLYVVMLSAILLVVGSNIVTSAASSGYSGKVTKYKDYESSYMQKANKSSKATNNVTKKPSGSFACWVETKTGSNCTYSTSYSSNGKYYMSYKQNFDSSNTCAENLYDLKYNLKLNISTVLVNFTSGKVSGTWSPDKL